MSLVWSPDYAPVDADFADVSLLLLGEGTNGSTTILDSSSNTLSVTANGDAQIINTVATPFSPTVPSDGVLAFDGTGDFLTIPSSPLIHVFGSDFTLEGWFQLNTAQSNDKGTILSTYGNPSASSGYLVRITATAFRFYQQNNSQDRAFAFSVGQWYHWAVTSEAGTGRIFINGKQQGATISVVGPNSVEDLTVGRIPVATSVDFNGYLSNIRITKGVARYTENFDVPTAPFPIYSPTTRAQA